MNYLRATTLILLLLVISAGGTTLANARNVNSDERSIHKAETLDLRAILRQSENQTLNNKNIDNDFDEAQKYYLGHDSLKDFRRAAQHFERAAKRNDPAAQFCLAVMMLKGQGVAHDQSTARALLRQAKQGPRDNTFVRLAWYLDQ